jgi:hypothetical protein
MHEIIVAVCWLVAAGLLVLCFMWLTREACRRIR